MHEIIQYKLAVMATILVTQGLIDLLTTYLCLKLGGVEANRVMLWLLNKLGFFVSFVLIKGAVTLAVAYGIYTRAIAEFGAIVLILGYFAVIINNLIQLSRLKHNLKD